MIFGYIYQQIGSWLENQLIQRNNYFIIYRPSAATRWWLYIATNDIKTYISSNNTRIPIHCLLTLEPTLRSHTHTIPCMSIEQLLTMIDRQQLNLNPPARDQQRPQRALHILTGLSTIHYTLCLQKLAWDLRESAALPVRPVSFGPWYSSLRGNTVFLPPSSPPVRSKGGFLPSFTPSTAALGNAAVELLFHRMCK